MYTLLIVVFILGYVGIISEHYTKIDKAAWALLMASVCWTVYAIGGEEILSKGYSHTWLSFVASLQGEVNSETVRHFITEHEFFEHLSETASILFFLLGAMGIVEVIDRFQGFRVITDQIKTDNRMKMLWVICILTFVMSALLDNLTTTIVMLTLLKKLLNKQENRWIFAGMVVISANAGGAFSPIGDVTTIMLWIGGQVTAIEIIKTLFLPSLVCMLVPLIVFSATNKGLTERPQLADEETQMFTSKSEQRLIFGVGILCLLFVPIFKTYTHLPPFMGMISGLGVLWLITDILLRGKSSEDKRKLSLAKILRSFDTPTLLFFLGILTAVAALSSSGVLDQLAMYLDKTIGNIYGINMAIGFFSAIVDNVPLVAGAMGMYEIAPPGTEGYLAHFVTDGQFWRFLAYCAGTGGSMIIIGSAAGVAAMGLENIPFGWYLKKISWLAVIGYISGALVFLITEGVLF